MTLPRRQIAVIPAGLPESGHSEMTANAWAPGLTLGILLCTAASGFDAYARPAGDAIPSATIGASIGEETSSPPSKARKKGRHQGADVGASFGSGESENEVGTINEVGNDTGPDVETPLNASMSGPRASYGDKWGMGGPGRPAQGVPPDSARAVENPAIESGSVAEGYIDSLKNEEYSYAPGTASRVETDVGSSSRSIAGPSIYTRKPSPAINFQPNQ